ncbi:MAG: penicillin-binding protein activator [Proteobacteria bacterium]|nr:penicillin-binding protein activator [Pseudomonadota bacterium]
MFIKKFFNVYALCSVLCALTLAGCNTQNRDWGAEYADGAPTAAPATINQNFYAPGDTRTPTDTVVAPMPSNVPPSDVKTVAVLLPLSGPQASVGTSIQHAIEIAFFQKQPRSVMVAFNDIGGSKEQKLIAMQNVIARGPDIILGPVFADDVDLLRSVRPNNLPAITFTSDPTALGSGLFTFALLPNQGAEAIVQQMARNNDMRVLILAPDSKTGYMLANAALDGAVINNIRVAGLYFYREGDMGSQKAIAERAAMFNPRTRANTRAKEILADALIRQNMSPIDKANVNRQLAAVNRADTLGNLPYDAVLFLGTANDSKALASFLRYYDVPTNTVRFYGTAMWDADVLFSDMTLYGAQYASLPAISPDFSRVYTDVQGTPPNRMSSMGYDAAMLAISALSDPRQSVAAGLLDPSGYTGLDGLVRLRPNGTNERALQIMRLDASGTPAIAVPAAKNFVRPLYQTTRVDGRKPPEIEITSGINPMDYIQLPVGIAGIYTSQSYFLPGAASVGAAPSTAPAQNMSPIPVILPEDDSDNIVINSPNFQPGTPDAVARTMIDSVQISPE